MKIKTQEIVNEGVLIERWPCDVNTEGENQSNGSQEFLYEYEGNKYCVWMDWDDTPVDPNEMLLPIEETK